MKTLKQYQHPLIAFLIAVLIKLFVPAANGLTEIGVNVLAVFIPVLYLWIAEATDWTSFVGIVLLSLTGIMSINDVFAKSVGLPTTYILISCTLLLAILEQTGVTRKLATWFISRDIIKNKPFLFILFFLMADVFLSLFINVFVTTMLFISLGVEACNSMGYKKGDKFYTSIMLCVFWAMNASSVATPIARTMPLVIMNSATANFGITISVSKWMLLGIPYAFLIGIVGYLIIRYIVRPETDLFVNYDIASMKEAASAPLSKAGKVSIVAFILTVVSWLFPEFGSSFAPGLSSVLKTLGMAGTASIVVALLCVLHVEGKPVASFKDIIKKISIATLLFTAAVNIFGTAVSSEASGITAVMQNILSPITSGMSPVVLLIFLAIGTLIMTNFTSNMVSMVLFNSLATAMLAGSGMNVLVVSVVICFMANIAVLTPAATPINPLLFGPGHLDVKGSMKYNLLFILLSALVGIPYLLWVGNILL